MLLKVGMRLSRGPRWISTAALFHNTTLRAPLVSYVRSFSDTGTTKPVAASPPSLVPGGALLSGQGTTDDANIEKVCRNMCQYFDANGYNLVSVSKYWAHPLNKDSEGHISTLHATIKTICAAKDAHAAQRLIDLAQKDPRIAHAVGFEALLDMCKSQHSCMKRAQLLQDIEASFITAAVAWLEVMHYNTRAIYLDEIIEITKNYDCVYFPRLMQELFTVLYRKGLVQVDIYAKQGYYKHFAGDSIIRALQVIIFDVKDLRFADQFVKRMVRRGALTLFNTSIPVYTDVVLQLLAEMNGGLMNPKQAENFVHLLFSLQQGNKSLQNEYQIATAQALESYGFYGEIISFAHVMTSTFGAFLPHAVFCRLINAYFKQGDMTRGFTALNCLREGMLLDMGVLKYIDDSAAEGFFLFNADSSAEQLEQARSLVGSTSTVVTRKQFRNRAPYAPLSAYYHAMMALDPEIKGNDKSLYREHLQHLLRRMWADGITPDLQFLSQMMVQNLSAGVSVEVSLFCHSWVVDAIKASAETSIEFYKDHAAIEDVVELMLRCFLKKPTQFKKESNELLSLLLSLNMKMSSEVVWYLMRCMHKHGGHFPVISMYKDMSTKFEAQKQPQHAYVLAESLIALEEFEKAQYVLESLLSRGVAVPPYIFEKFPILILMRIRGVSDTAVTSFSKKAVAYAISLIARVPKLSRPTERNLNTLKHDSNPWVWKEMRVKMSELLNGPYAQRPAAHVWMNELLNSSLGPASRGAGTSGVLAVPRREEESRRISLARREK